MPPLLRMVWETHPGYTLTMAALRLLRSAVPVATLWVGKLILDTIVGMREGTPDLTQSMETDRFGGRHRSGR